MERLSFHPEGTDHLDKNRNPTLIFSPMYAIIFSQKPAEAVTINAEQDFSQEKLQPLLDFARHFSQFYFITAPF